MKCFEQKPMSERTKKLQKLGIGEVSKKDINLFKIDTFQTSGLTSVSLWVKLK